MATGRCKRDGEADDSVTKLTCPICLDHYRRPKLLSCFHTFCQSCLQGVAGSSPSFPCPSCRSLVLLPPGGVKALQTNFYIEDESASSSSSPPRRLCDVCADDREATHSCLQCQQRYCLPCCKYHDSFTLSRGHTVVALTEEDEGCGKGMTEKRKVDLCPKHPDQRLLFHCTKCKVSLCLQCKLTQHDGHPTLDLADASAKVKDKLRDRLRTLTQDIQEIDHTLGAFDDRCSKLQEHKETTEAAFRARADTLHQWVKQSLEEAVSSLQSSSEQLAKPWRDRAEQLGNRKRALQAQQDHILQVLTEGQEADLVSLEVQLSSRPEEDVTMTQMKAELTQDMPTFRAEYTTTAVNLMQLLAFVGTLAPPQQTSGPEGTVTPPVLPSPVQGKVSAAVSAKGPILPPPVQGKVSAAVSAKGPILPPPVQGKVSAAVSAKGPVLPPPVQGKVSAAVSAKEPDLPPPVQGKVSATVSAKEPDLPPPIQGKVSAAVSAKGPVLPPPVQGKVSAAVSVKEPDLTMHRRDCLPSMSNLVKVRRKKPPREFSYSKSPEYCVRALCPISQSRLWVMYRPVTSSPPCLELFDDEGQVLTTVGNPRNCDGLVPITDDVILAWSWDNSSVQLITPDGSLDTYDVGSKVDRILSSAMNDNHYLVKRNEETLCCVNFVHETRTGNSASGCAASRPALSMTPAMANQLTPSLTEVVFDATPSQGNPLHASKGGRYFVFLSGHVEVYSRAGLRSSALICSYKPRGRPFDACFCLIDGQEMLLVTVPDDNKVHIINHTDGGCFVRYLNTEPLNLDRPRHLATDYDRYVWIGCRGGKVAVVDLSP